jgi:ribonuclease-3
LGDSVLGLLVAEDLFRRFPDRAEGELSRIKSSVVSRYALRGVAQAWELTDLLTLGPGFRDLSDVPHSVIADAVEAVLGAVFIDGGLSPVRHLVQAEFGPLIERASDRTRASNHKSELQAYTQGELGFTPNYTVRAEEGPDHDKTFTVSAMVNGIELAVATGRNKRQAEQRAARDALSWLRSAKDGEHELPPELRIHLSLTGDDEPDDTTG